MALVQVWHAVKSFNYRMVFDVLVVAWLIFRLLLLAKGTRAWQIIGGLMVFVVVVIVSDKLRLYSLHWLLKQAFPLGPVALVILFLPELRHALEEFGRPGFWGSSLGLGKTEEMGGMIDAVVAAVSTMAVKRIGALIVFERETGLEDIISTGTLLNAETTGELVCTIFQPGSPLHDGAIVVRQDRIMAAGCTLPLTVSPRVDAAVHTRHKAALGMSEQSDAFVVIVSEETGTVSIAMDGKLVRGLRDETLRQRLAQLLHIGDFTKQQGAFRQVATRVGTALKGARRGYGQ